MTTSTRPRGSEDGAPSAAIKRSLPLAPSVFAATVAVATRRSLQRTGVGTLQVNVGARCNMACLHCHVEAGPMRTETIDHTTAAHVIRVLAANPQVHTLDLTGGAPELSSEFRYLVREARALGRHVIDRCNLSILFEPGQEELGSFLAQHEVHVVASLPCYSLDNVDAQRGKGAFDDSLAGLRLLNRLGYGARGSRLELDLVYNPVGPTLPPPQAALEERYRQELATHFDIVFHRLLTITNMPIKRFSHALDREGRYVEYMNLLTAHFNPATVPGLMCRSLLSVGYDGSLYDCDFNQMLQLPLGDGAEPVPLSLADVTSLRVLEGLRVRTADHCFGCTAGSGSSCSGATTRE